MAVIREFKLNGKLKPKWGRLMEKMELDISSIGEFQGIPGRSVGALRFVDPVYEEIAGDWLSGENVLEVRWGMGDDAVSPWYSFIIFNADLQYFPSGGSVVHFHLMDHGIRMENDSRFKAFSGVPFSKVVSGIAKLYKLPEAVVEETAIEDTYIQAGDSDWEFLSRYLPGQAKKKDNSGGYRLFFRNGNEIHFHAPDYAQKAYRSFNIMSGAVGCSFTMRTNPFKRAKAGGEGVSVVGYDRDTLEFFESSFDTSKVTGKFTGRQDLKLVGEAKTTGAKSGNIFHGLVGKSKGEKQASGLFYSAFLDGHKAELKWVDDPLLAPGHLVYINAKVGEKSLTGEGLWLVDRVRRKISHNSGEMVVSLSRPLFLSSNVGKPLPGAVKNTSVAAGTGQLSPLDGKSKANFIDNKSKSVKPKPLV